MPTMILITRKMGLYVLFISLANILQMFNESVTSVAGGMVSSNYEEVVVATYSGRVLGLTRELGGATQPISQEVQAKIEALK